MIPLHVLIPLYMCIYIPLYMCIPLYIKHSVG